MITSNIKSPPASRRLRLEVSLQSWGSGGSGRDRHNRDPGPHLHPLSATDHRDGPPYAVPEQQASRTPRPRSHADPGWSFLGPDPARPLRCSQTSQSIPHDHRSDAWPGRDSALLRCESDLLDALHKRSIRGSDNRCAESPVPGCWRGTVGQL